MRSEWFDYVPTYKIWFAFNQLPEIEGTDDGIWRRIKYVPFTVRITEEEKDPGLPEKLRHEQNGILRWAVEGCQQWLRLGSLSDPVEVRQATNSYRAEMDVVAAFLEERCIVCPGSRTHTTSAGNLYEAFQEWCSSNGERIVSRNEFGKYLSQKGVKTDKSNGTRIRRGIALLS